ncbi:NAD(P)H-quinone oxidoreductase [Myxococcus vastator]|uniref:NAD(P)H-quinone oxidoreductase n=1 Tax=Myxococcus vastator TaxID=2709664 RepID=UPI001F0748C6|nr:NAD(P)H-quinone oxidoreductase [Myxococcus vastator]
MRTTDAVMRAVTQDRPGGPEVFRLCELPRPVPGPRQLRVRVRAAALNRGDILQRSGAYPLPPGVASPLIGVEVAGEVEACGAEVHGFEPGQRVFGLVDGGGYADACLMEAGMAIPMPAGWRFVEAAATPEAFFTAHEALLELGGLRAGQAVLIHAGGSGVGTACIQVARAVGARGFFTVSTEEKRRRCLALGGEAGVLRTEQDFARELPVLTGGAGVDLVADFVGGAALARNLSVLKFGGCLLLLGVLDGMEGALDVRQAILRRLQLRGMSLRPLPLEEKVAVTRRFRERWLPELEAGRVRPIIDSTFPLERVADAHRRMESNASFGKIVLEL